MIISKDLFYLGDEYLRLPKQEKFSIYSPEKTPRLNGTENMNTPIDDVSKNFNNMCLVSEKCRTVSTILPGFNQISNSQMIRPLNLVFKDLCYKINHKPILKDVSGLVKPGELLAVMGPSGSGKTSLLNALAGRIKYESGDITLNGKQLNKQLKRKICYVLQQDIFFPDLTLRQTLLYTALLRLPDSMCYQDKVDLVDHIIDVLELNRCQDTIIGDVMNRGLSGGEKKRANIACELLTNPAVMLVDEPTSGLDSCTAYSLLSTLKKYAQNESKSIVVTIHQPSSQMFYMFDRLLLMCNGQVAYFGDVDKVVEYFCKIGLEIIPHYNPADFIMEQMKKGPEIQDKIILSGNEQRKESSYPIELRGNYGSYASSYLQDSIEDYCSDGGSKNSSSECSCPDVWKNDNDEDTGISQLTKSSDESANKKMEIRVVMNSQDTGASVYTKIASREDDDSGRSSWSDYQECSSNSSHSLVNSKHPKWPTSFWTQFKVLTQRNFHEAKGRMLSRLNWIQAIGLAIVSGLIWFQVERTEDRLTDIMGWMFFGMTYWMLFALFGALISFPPEREVINKERASGAYRLSAYYLAKMVGELPLIIAMPTIYHLISYPMLGFNNPLTFLSLWGILLLNTIVAQSVGLFIGASCIDLQLSVAISSLFSLSTMLFGGYYTGTMPPWVQWLQYGSMVYYAFNNMLIIEFEGGPPIRCSAEQSRFSACLHGNKTHIPIDDILQMKGPSNPFWVNTLTLVGFFVFFRLMGYLVLRFIRKPK